MSDGRFFFGYADRRAARDAALNAQATNTVVECRRCKRNRAIEWIQDGICVPDPLTQRHCQPPTESKQAEATS